MGYEEILKRNREMQRRERREKLQSQGTTNGMEE